MRYFLSTSLLVILHLSSVFCQSQGIIFQNKTWANILKTAQAENKYIFIDAYADYCLPCKAMEKEAFREASVADFFNSHFVNYKMDIEASTNDYLVQIYQIKELPALLFFNQEGRLIQKIIGKQEAMPLLQLAKKATKNNFGEKSKEFANTIPLEKLLADINHYKMYHGGKRVNWMVKKQVYSQVLQAAMTQNKASYERAIFAAQKAKLPDSDSFIFNMRTLFSQLSEDWILYFEVTDHYLNLKENTNPKELNEIAWAYYLHLNQPQQLQKAIQRVEQSIRIESEPYNNYTYAALLYKVGASKKAQKVAEQAIYMAKARGFSTQPIEYLIEKNTKR